VRADSMSSLIVAAGERRGLLGVGFENMMRSWGHEMKGPAGTGRSGVSMAGGQEGQGARKGNGVSGHRLPPSENLLMYFLEFANVFRTRKIVSKHSFCVLMYMNSYIFHIYFILFIFLSNTYLIFDCICLTFLWPTHIELPNTHAHVYEGTHTHTHTHTKYKD